MEGRRIIKGTGLEKGGERIRKGRRKKYKRQEEKIEKGGGKSRERRG